MIYIFLAEGFEECEALAPVDILRRAGLDIQTVGVGGKTVTGSHGISVVCDTTTDDTVTQGLEAVILPGGMPGTLNLENDPAVQSLTEYAFQNGLIIGAICAAPLILGHKGILKGKKATCFTGFEKELSGAEVLDQPVVRDGNIITAYGAGAAFDFGFTLLSALKGENAAENMKTQMRYTK